LKKACSFHSRIDFEVFGLSQEDSVIYIIFIGKKIQSLSFNKIMILNHSHQERRDAFELGEGRIYESIGLVFNKKKLRS